MLLQWFFQAALSLVAVIALMYLVGPYIDRAIEAIDNSGNQPR